MIKYFLFVAMFIALLNLHISCDKKDDQTGFVLDGYEVVFDANGGMNVVTIVSGNINNVYAIPDAGWINVAVDAEIITVTVTKNDSEYERTGKIRISALGDSETYVKVIQTSVQTSPDNISVLPTSWVFSQKGGEKEFAVITDLEGWDAEISGTGFTITGWEGNVVTVTAAANHDEDARGGELTIKHGEISAIVELEQRGMRPATLSDVETSYVGTVDGNTAELKLVFATENGNETVSLLAYTPEADFLQTLLMPAGNYPVSASKEAKTILKSMSDGINWSHSYVEIGDSKFVAVRDGGMTLELSDGIYTMTLDATGVDVKNGNAEEHVYYTYTGEITFDIGPIGSELEYEDIPENSYTASGDPFQTQTGVTALSSWAGSVTHETGSAGYPYYKFSNFGMPAGEQIPFFIRYYPDEKNIALILDAGMATQAYLYVLNVFFEDNGVWSYIPTQEATGVIIRPAYDKATRTLSLAGLQVDGKDAYFGINAYDRSAGEYSHTVTAVYNDLAVSFSDTRDTSLWAGNTASGICVGTPIYIGATPPAPHIP